MLPVADMLIAILNCCSKEELEEEEEDEVVAAPVSPSGEKDERRKVIRNKILAVGRMSRVFSLLRYVHIVLATLKGRTNIATFYREESEKVSELKNISGTSRLPAGALASGAEGIRHAITNFDDA